MKPDIWRWFGGEWKVHCPDRATWVAMLEISGSRKGGTYTTPDSKQEYDVIVPSRYFDRAKNLLEKRNKKEPVIER